MSALPPDLPVPEDDGACKHLPGQRLPALSLPSTAGTEVDLSHRPGIVVVYCYPMTAGPDRPLPAGWDKIPGARGCTPQACSFRDRYDDLQHLGAEVFGVSTQDTGEQHETVERLRLAFELLSDTELRFAQSLRLPTFEADGRTLIKRLTLIARDSVIEKVFYPVYPPDRNVDDVIAWLRANRYTIMGG
ncbi:MAG: peroxiredoxin [Chromatiales bacterium]